MQGSVQYSKESVSTVAALVEVWASLQGNRLVSRNPAGAVFQLLRATTGFVEVCREGDGGEF
jgi:hypothetical protein